MKKIDIDEIDIEQEEFSKMPEVLNTEMVADLYIATTSYEEDRVDYLINELETILNEDSSYMKYYVPEIGSGGEAQLGQKFLKMISEVELSDLLPFATSAFIWIRGEFLKELLKEGVINPTAKKFVMLIERLRYSRNTGSTTTKNYSVRYKEILFNFIFFYFSN